MTRNKIDGHPSPPHPSPPAPVSRRAFLGSAAAGVAALASSPLRLAADSKSITPAAAFDPAIEEFMKERGVPGAALAVLKDRRLVYARGYGWADRDRKIPATPDSLFRIASISKPFTAVAVLRLVQDKKLALDARVFDVLNLGAQLPPNAQLDERWKQISIRQLLHHTAGWDREQSGDPMFNSREIARAVDEPPPAKPSAIIRWMLGRPLDFDPGARYAYSNFGYCLLGRVIEKLTRRPYETFMRESILAPAGIRRMRIGASNVKGRAKGEVCYYMQKDSKNGSVLKDSKSQVPLPYGSFYLEAMDSHGAWIASAVDLVRFAAALDDPAHSPLLRPEFCAQLYDPPAPPVSRNAAGQLADHYYGCGWLVRPVGENGKANYWHNGSLPGTYTFLVRLASGVSYAILFNQRSDDGKNGDAVIDPALVRAARAVTDWPQTDLFKTFK